MSEAISTMPGAGIRERRRTLFFPVMATVMALVALAGFSRTFYFRAFTGVEDPITGASLPLHIVAHGVVFSLWMLVFLAQSWLVFSGRIRIHRALGYAGLATAVLVVVFGANATILFVPRTLSMDLALRGVTSIFFGNFIALASFAVFVGLAYRWRRNPENHKRMMYFATISIIGPALAMGDRPLGTILGEFVPRPGIVGPMIFVALILAYDYLRDSRLRAVTLWSGFAIAAKYSVNLLLIAPSEVAQSAVLALRMSS